MEIGADIGRYIVVDLMTGGDLRFHISRKTFTEEAVRFWIAELGCALRYVHGQGIVHRDVKPDNVLLDNEGHVHLADFNVASDLTPHKPLTSKSGTLAYLAPEVYMGKGYYSEVDWWSLGVLFYECIYNKRPFEANNHDALAQAIVKADPAFPVTSPPVSMPCLHAISSLLEKDKTQRIGSAGFDTFTDNPFFRELDFDALLRKEVEPVFCPSSEKTNFDATYDLEELLLEEAPLEARARKQKPRAELREDATPQEIRADELHRMVETMFEPFNYTLVPETRDPAAAVAAAASAPAPAGQPASEKATSTETVRQQDKDRATPSPRAHTPGSTSRARSTTRSGTGSPTYHAAPMPPQGPPPQADLPPLPPPPSSDLYQQSREARGREPRERGTRTVRYEDTTQSTLPSTGSRLPPRPRGSTRSTSLGGGVQVVLNEQGSWSDMANQSAGMVDAESGRDGKKAERSPGMLGLFSRKKGRDRSPKGKEKERGVLGKEGARVVISSG